jgi:hypothetical protein
LLQVAQRLGFLGLVAEEPDSLPLPSILGARLAEELEVDKMVALARLGGISSLVSASVSTEDTIPSTLSIGISIMSELAANEAAIEVDAATKLEDEIFELGLSLGAVSCFRLMISLKHFEQKSSVAGDP